MKLKFLGATGTVTGSKYLIEHNQTKVFITHGEAHSANEFKTQLEDKLNLYVEIPGYLDEVEL